MYGSSERGGYGDSSLSELMQYPSRLAHCRRTCHRQTAKGEGVDHHHAGKDIVPQPTVNDHVYQGDVIETGLDGLVGIVFVDGTTFHLHAGAHMVLDEFIYGAEKLPGSALFRVKEGCSALFPAKWRPLGD